MKLKEPEKILELEFDYIKEIVHQTIEDRYRMLNFYIGLVTTVGTLVIGLLSFTGNNISNTTWIFLASIFFAIAIVGWLFVAMMIRLRQAWKEAITSLNKIKEYYFENTNIKNLEDAFLWRTKTIPKTHKLMNIHFYSTLLIILLDSGSLAAATGIILLLADTGVAAYIVAGIIFILGIIFQSIFYRVSLARNI